MEMTSCAQARRADRRAARPVRDRCARYRVRDPARRRRRPRRAAAGARRRRRHPDPVGHHDGRRGAGRRAAAQGGRQGRDRPGQRRCAGGHRPRRAGGQRPAVQHHHRRRTRAGPAARGGQEDPGRRCLGAGGGVEAQPVHRCRDSPTRRSGSSGSAGSASCSRPGSPPSAPPSSPTTPTCSRPGRPPSASGWSTCRPCWPTADIISIHLPRTPETLGLIGAAELATVKPGVLIVNAARGGLIDEQALADALTDGRVAGAGIDVYVKEPLAADSPLRTAPNTVLTPHLGASTAEAQDKAGTAVAKSVKLALRGDFVPGRGERAGRRAGVRRAAAVDPAGVPARHHPDRGRRRRAQPGGRRGARRSGRPGHLDPAAGRGPRHLRRRHHRGRHLRQRAGARRRARADPDRHLHRGDRRLPVVGHAAGGDGRRRVPDGVRDAVRQQPGRQADRDQQPALRPARRGQPAGGGLRGPARA